MSVDPRAATGFANAVEAYERGRPDYPDAAVDAIGITAAETVLDLAAGSGKLTRQVAARAGRVIAVDPSEPMLAALRRRSPEVDARVGVAQAIPLDDASVDVVTIGAAIHWFGDETACREIARVLRPGGRVAVLGYEAAWDDQPWHEDFKRLVTPVREAAGEFPHVHWEQPLAAAIGPLHKQRFEHVQHLDADGFVQLVASWSWVVNVAEVARDALLSDVRRLVGDVRLRYVTELATASRAR